MLKISTMKQILLSPFILLALLKWNIFNRGEITPTCGKIKAPCESSGKIYGGEINVHHKQLYISKLLCYTWFVAHLDDCIY